MTYATEHIASTLKAARETRGLSQRALSTKSGVPQSHISKIENGAVDLRVSSLVALARVLDLELTLVPRKSMSAIKSIVRSSAQRSPMDGDTTRQTRKELARLQNATSQLPPELLPKNVLEQFQRQARELQHFQLSQSDLKAVRQAFQAVKAFTGSPENLRTLQQSFLQLRDMRNARAHGLVAVQQVVSPRPAYSLDEDDDG